MWGTVLFGTQEIPNGLAKQAWNDNLGLWDVFL